MADISTAEGDRYTAIIWEERTYVPYYAVLKKDCGALITKENIAANQPILDVIRTFTEKKEATSAQISLAWMLHKYPNCVPIPGSKNQERILENLGAWNVELMDDEFATLEIALYACSVHGHRGHIEVPGGR